MLTKFGRPSTLDIDKDIAYNYNRRKSTVKETKVFWQPNIQMIVDYAFPLCGLIAISVWILKECGKVSRHGQRIIALSPLLWHKYSL